AVEEREIREPLFQKSIEQLVDRLVVKRIRLVCFQQRQPHAAEAEIHSMFLFHVHRSHRNPGISAAVFGKLPPYARHKAALFCAAISPVVSILEGFAVFCNPDSSCSSIRKTYVSFGYRHHLSAGGPPGACSRGNCNAARKPPEA